MNRAFISAVAVLCLAIAAAGQTQGTLKGKIETEKGKPIADVEVRVIRTIDNASKETKTDKSGGYSFELEPGHYSVHFDAEGYQSGVMPDMQQVEEGKTTTVKTVRLGKDKGTSRIRGAVFDEQGRSLPGVRLKLVRVATEQEMKEGKRSPSFSGNYITNSRGEFAFRVPSERARYLVTASRSGYTTQSKTVEVGEDESVPLAFSLEPAKK